MPWYQAHASSVGRQMVFERHRGKGNCLFADGHALPITGDQWVAASWNPSTAP